MKKLISSKVITDSNIAFGTSGARGLVNDFTPNVCAAFALAFVKSISDEFKFNTVALAIDNRPSSYSMAQACTEGLKQLNIETIFYGVIPTPALAYKAMQDAMPCIMITGSHIPFDRNGIKFYRPDGEISKSDEHVILTEKVEFAELSELDDLTVSNSAAEAYITRYTSLFDTPWLTGKRIGIYEHSSAGRDLYYRIFEKLGAEVISLQRSDEFVPIDTEAVSEKDTAKAIAWSEEHNLDAVFSTDGDGDRPLITDENGNWLRGDILGLLTSDALNIDAVVVPVSCNTAIELCERFTHVERTKIGSPYVIAQFSTLADKYKSIAGFEANGGYLLGTDIQLNGQILKALPTRDAILPAIMLLALAEKTSISVMVNELPKRFTDSNRIQNFATEKSQQIISQGKKDPTKLLTQLGFVEAEIKSVDETDGLRMTFTDERIIHLRPSGNAPELRCYAEAESYSVANQYVTKSLDNIKKL